MSAGYSGTPLPKKLGIEEGSRVADRCARGRELLDPFGGLWVVWPRQSSPLATEMSSSKQSPPQRDQRG